MLDYLTKRLVSSIPLLIGVTLTVFLFIHLIPGDPARVMLGEHADEEALANLREELGLNDPFHVQYFRFLGRLVTGDLGRSFITRSSVGEELARRFPATVELTFAAMTVALLVGIPAGLIAAVRQYSWFDNLSMVGALVGVSMPIFWFGLMLIWFGAVTLGWFPPSGRLSVTVDFAPITNLYIVDSILKREWHVLADAARHLVLPATALGTIPMAIIARMTRSSMLEVLNQDYVRTARAKGLREWSVVVKHGLRNAFIPVLTVTGLQFGFLLGGAVLTETIFAWPGIGRYIYTAVLERDFPVLQGAILLVAFTFVLINLIVDLLYAVLDPRIQYD